MKILVIEDEKSLADSIVSYLKKESYIVEVAFDLDSAMLKTGVYEYDCIVLDVMLPDGSGLDVIKELKGRESDTGIIIISARDSLKDKVTGLDIGADDYVTKPFHLAELNARIKSVIRRKQFGGAKSIVLEEISIDTDSCEVHIHNQPVELTKKEYQLLLYFISNRNRVLTKESIAEHLWGDFIIDADSFDFIYTHIKNLRRKILRKGGKDYIRTVYGMGYIFRS